MTNKNSSTGVAPRCQFHFSDGRCCRMLRLTPARLTGRRESGQFHFSVTAFTGTCVGLSRVSNFIHIQRIPSASRTEGDL